MGLPISSSPSNTEGDIHRWLTTVGDGTGLDPVDGSQEAPLHVRRATTEHQAIADLGLEWRRLHNARGSAG
jgi:hypothetical protein